MSRLRTACRLALFLHVVAVVSSGGSPAPAPVLERFSGGGVWTTGYSAAREQAAKESKLVLLAFSGSDWCVWCQRFESEILAKDFFLDYARDHLVLVRIDFPRHKKLAESDEKQNTKLAEAFKVVGYPTLILVDATGHELGRTGYMYGGPKTFVRELKRFIARSSLPEQKTS